MFPPWDLCKGAVVNISVQVFVWAPDLVLWGYVPSWGIAGSYGNSVFCTARGSQTVSTVAVSSRIPSAVWEGPSFSSSLPALVIFFFSPLRWSLV